MSPFRSSGAPHNAVLPLSQLSALISLPTSAWPTPPLRPPAVPAQTRAAPLPSLPAEHLAGKVKNIL